MSDVTATVKGGKLVLTFSNLEDVFSGIRILDKTDFLEEVCEEIESQPERFIRSVSDIGSTVVEAGSESAEYDDDENGHGDVFGDDENQDDEEDY